MNNLEGSAAKHKTAPEIRCEFTRLVPVAEVVPNPRNPNTHPPEQVELLAKIIAFQGWRLPIVVSKSSGFVVRGHGRLLAAHVLGLAEVPVDEQEYASEAQEHADLIADNRIAELAEVDRAGLKDLIEQLDTGELDLDLTGYDGYALGELMSEFFTGGLHDVDEDFVPERVRTRAKVGDLFTLGDHRILCGDSTQPDDVKKALGGKRAAIVFTDPPYGVNIHGGKMKGEIIAGDLTSTAIPFSFELAVGLATEAKARLFFCGGEGNLGLYAKLFDRYLGQLPKHLIWVKEGFVLKQNGYHNQYELIFYGFKEGGGGRAHWFGERTGEHASDVWQIHRDNVSEYLHPTQKPVALASRAIRNHTKPGAIVYEPFSGSGSTLIACEKLGRKCLALDLDPHFVDVTVERWEQFTGKKAKKAKK